MDKVRWVGLVALVLALAVTSRASAGSSTTVHRIESEAVAGNMMGITSTRRVLVYTPAGYDESRRVYPVIYWIPGWKTPASSEYVGALDAAIAKRWIPPVIVATIDVREGVLMLNSPVFGNWADFLMDEVVPFVDAEYRTIPVPKGRALMGHSTGGYAAMLLPLLYPGIWSAVGLNDASVWGACARGRGWQHDSLEAFSLYSAMSASSQAWVQVAIATAPNLDVPRYYDAPWIEGAGSDVEAKWDSRCLSNEGMLRDNLNALEQLKMIALALPTGGGRTNVGVNRGMAKALRAVGNDPTVLYVPGTHGSHRAERFVFLAGLVTSVMAAPSFDVSRSRALAWGSLKGTMGAETFAAVAP